MWKHKALPNTNMKWKGSRMSSRGRNIGLLLFECCWRWWREILRSDATFPNVVSLWHLDDYVGARCRVCNSTLRRPLVEYQWGILDYPAPCYLNIWLFQTIMLCLPVCLSGSSACYTGNRTICQFVPQKASQKNLQDQNTCIIIVPYM